jgi:topoisomerase-4 subunit A
VNRLNYDEHGRLLGEFFDDDQILVVLKNGDFYLTNFDVNNHFEENILRIEKFDADKVWTCVLFDADNQGFPYLKRFLMEASKRKQNFLGENSSSKMVLLTDVVYPLVKVTYGGADAYRGSEEIDAEQFITVKGFKAKGKRLSTWQIESIEELPPTRFPEEPEESEEDRSEKQNDIDEDPDAGKSQQQIIDEMTGQLRLFSDDE